MRDGRKNESKTVPTKVKLRLLDSQCDVGIGALAPLQCLLRKSVINPEEALATLLQTVNDSKDPIVMEFWQLLQQEEGLLREKFKTAS